MNSFAKPDDALDRAVDLVRQHMESAARSSWQACEELRRIHDEKLWQRRINYGGDQAYESFADFAAKELALGKSQAYSLLDVARNFTAKDVDRFGTTRLLVLLNAPPAKRDAIRTLMLQGASLRKMKREFSDRSENSLTAELVEARRLAAPKGLISLQGGAALVPPTQPTHPPPESAPPAPLVRSMVDIRREHEYAEAAKKKYAGEPGRDWSVEGKDWAQAIERLAQEAPVQLLERLDERRGLRLKKADRHRAIKALAELAKVVVAAQRLLIKEMRGRRT